MLSNLRFFVFVVARAPEAAAAGRRARKSVSSSSIGRETTRKLGKIGTFPEPRNRRNPRPVARISGGGKHAAP
eukprot:10906647-Alexandrium_andersonii.AAC.1